MRKKAGLRKIILIVSIVGLLLFSTMLMLFNHPAQIPSDPRLQSALDFVDEKMRRDRGHIDLYLPLADGQNISQWNHTNSEAVSYYMQITAQQGDKERFDEELLFMQQKMVHPQGGFLMWRLDDRDIAEGEGKNIASDADLRALHALYLAKDTWDDEKYDAEIERLADGLERVAIVDGIIVAYGGLSGDPWMGQESYLGYADYQVIDRLARTRGGVWRHVADRMRNASLDAQIWNGLYNTVYFTDGRYGSHADGGHYSVHSLWTMVRFAESGDTELMRSANKSLNFYLEKYAKDGRVVISYTSSGDQASGSEGPWAYALVARASHALGNREFAEQMLTLALRSQVINQSSPLHGAIIEGSPTGDLVGQFTMQETILTMQEMQGHAKRI